MIRLLILTLLSYLAFLYWRKKKDPAYKKSYPLSDPSTVRMNDIYQGPHQTFSAKS